ncbi:MAG: ChbG/HpnK family deacetylase [Clostridia bacterium]|nr:ChbG/HpnK family deacetylase [Clostridia bacterium]
MIYFCADDYGLCGSASAHIQHCVDAGALNKVSVFPNFDRIDLQKIRNNKNIRISLHLNLVEGRCMADANEIDLLADKAGNLKHTFGGLFKLSLLHPKRFEAQAYREIKAQVMAWKDLLHEDIPFCIDSHQHTHMIPAVFRALVDVLTDEKISPEYMRIPVEPILLFIKTPSLYFTYSPVNIVKQWLLKFLWLIDKRWVKKDKIPESYFFGILFSGRMDEKRVGKILPKYIKMANKDGRDVEVLFHPGYVNENEIDFKNKNVVFENFYFSENRKTEFDSAMKISERSVL